MNATQQQRVRVHIADCHSCGADLAWLEHIITLMRADALELPPASARERVRATCVARRTAVQRYSARIIFDSAAVPRAVGLRSPPATSRQLLYATPVCDLDLRLVRAGELWSLVGQVLGPDASGTVRLLGEAGQVQAELSQLGEFTLPAVPDGRYVLTVVIDELEIVIPDLALRA